MFEMGAETMKLPLDEKMKFEQGDEGMSFGYVSTLNSAERNFTPHLQVQSRRRKCNR